MADKTENGRALVAAVGRDGESAQRGREMLASMYPDESEETEMPEETADDVPSSRPSLAEAQKDLKDGVGAFVAGVDTITDALLAILGKFDESIRRVEAVNRLVKISTLASFTAVVVVAVVLVRLELVVVNLQANETAMMAVRVQLESSLEALRAVRVQQTRTDLKVDAVKREVKDGVKDAVKDAVKDVTEDPSSPPSIAPTGHRPRREP